MSPTLMEVHSCLYSLRYGILYDVETADISPKKLHSPLSVALAISLLFLLVNHPLVNLAFSKKTIFEV